MQYPSSVNENKAELFSIGITMLEVASLEDCVYVYTRNPLKIEQEKIDKLIKQVQKKYSSFLLQILQ
jgi:hypothetical protein